MRAKPPVNTLAYEGCWYILLFEEKCANKRKSFQLDDKKMRGGMVRVVAKNCFCLFSL